MNDVPQNDPALARWFFLDGDNDRMHAFPSKYESLRKTGSPYAEHYRGGWESMDRDFDQLDPKFGRRQCA